MAAASLWSDWFEDTAADAIRERDRQQDIAARAFAAGGRREDYEFTAEAAAAREPGRRLVQAFERCRVTMLRRLARPPEQGGFGWRLTYEQERLFEAMRDAELLKMYDGSIERYMNDLEWLRKYTPRPEELYTNVAVILPRRSGKSFIEELVSDILALAFGTIGGNILNYNMTWAAAKRWLSDANSMIHLMQNDEEFGWKVVQHSLGKSLHIKLKNGGGNPNAITSIQVFGNATNAKTAQNLRGAAQATLLLPLLS
jgi:hypothetical protein